MFEMRGDLGRLVRAVIGLPCSLLDYFSPRGETNDMNDQKAISILSHDESKSCPGYVLYQPMYAERDVLLVDLGGDVVHRWAVGAPGLWGYLLPNGNLFHCGKADPAEGEDLFFGWRVVQGGVLREVDPSGRVVWEHRDHRQHHDARRTSTGGAIYLAIEQMPDELVAVRQRRSGWL